LSAGREGHGHVAFHEFPTDPVLFTPDLRPHVREIIERHGPEEWRLCVLTSETHQHLGMYSIAGAKMGLRAREVLDAGVGEVRVLSHAGSKPPLSCLNDGLQVSTGATLGHGTISVAGDSEPRPEATFTRGGRAVRLRLKPAYWEQIRTDIARGIEEHGTLTPAYFYFVRRLSIRYWLKWDRTTIFEVEEATA